MTGPLSIGKYSASAKGRNRRVERGRPPERTEAATIMVVDDESSVRTMLGMALSEEGFRVVEASSGEKAIELLEQGQPDLILLDLLMPGLTGLETLRRIRERSSVPVTMLTALSRVEDIEISLEAGADDYCTKPMDLPELLARLRARLRCVDPDTPRRIDAEFPEIPGDRELEQARATNKCVARSELGFLCWRPVAKDLRRRGLDVCRKHAPDPRLLPATQD
jgi:DNA-binding response OmpR family regulator